MITPAVTAKNLNMLNNISILFKIILLNQNFAVPSSIILLESFISSDVCVQFNTVSTRQLIPRYKKQPHLCLTMKHPSLLNWFSFLKVYKEMFLQERVAIIF